MTDEAPRSRVEHVDSLEERDVITDTEGGVVAVVKDVGSFVWREDSWVELEAPIHD